MAGSDPAGRPPRARLGHRQRPRGPSPSGPQPESQPEPQDSRNPRRPQVSLRHLRNPCWLPAVKPGKLLAGGQASADRLQLNRGMIGFDFGG